MSRQVAAREANESAGGDEELWPELKGVGGLEEVGDGESNGVRRAAPLPIRARWGLRGRQVISFYPKSTTEDV
ncbi:hypothetical protein HALLA_06320 [Halostagnicola larsenii XH-48]|uniref:Uncharacterized protein n=1 Tax=Halostagnicola larsenii XH-48 TaxID=797299 RepID=W0JTY2_9EURY|nr:hypothetical protein [Halostagnicola larsenii]AHG00762.1 hypothetical protein HALLA_06320 [Halostagnicola larsenii XH-48]